MVCSPCYQELFPQHTLHMQVIALSPSSDSRASRAVYVSIFSIANCLGRLMSGYLPDKLMHKQHIPRTVPLVVMTLLTLTAGTAFSPLLMTKALSLPVIESIIESQITGLIFACAAVPKRQ